MAEKYQITLDREDYIALRHRMRLSSLFLKSYANNSEVSQETAIELDRLYNIIEENLEYIYDQ